MARILRFRNDFYSARRRFKDTAFIKTLAESQSCCVIQQTVGCERREQVQPFALEHEIAGGAGDSGEPPERVFAQHGIPRDYRLVMRGRGGDVSRGFGFAAEQVFVIWADVLLRHGDRSPEQH